MGGVLIGTLLIGIIAMYGTAVLLLGVTKLYEWSLHNKIKTMLICIAILILCFGPTTMLIQYAFRVLLTIYIAYWLYNNLNKSMKL
jgi:type III secretory pathway component EscS